MEDKIQEAYDKMLEGTDIKAVLKNMDQNKYNSLKDRYYAVADNIYTLVALLANETELKKEHKNATLSLKSFNKMDLGKYI